MSLTEKQIEENKIKFLKLIAEIDIEGADTNGLVSYLDENGFFESPASTVYHSGYKGGLCQHSLNVFEIIQDLAQKYFPDK